MKLAVVIVSYRVQYYLEQCITSVERATEGISREIVVVDNHSGDGTVEYLKERFGDRITLIESNHNLGFSKANNIAIRQTDSEYVLLLNPDTFVTEDSLSQVLRFMDENHSCGGCGVKMHNADGSVARESRRGLPTPWVSLLKMMGFSDRYYMSHLPWDKPVQIEAISGAFCMLRREALNKVGLLDEDFFMYGEDIDLSYRLLKGGYENWYVPASIVHYKGEHRPLVITPDFSGIETEGLSDEAKAYAEFLRQHESDLRILRYGFRLKADNYTEYVVTDRLSTVTERVRAEVAQAGDELAAVIQGVDEPWDVALVELWMREVRRSADGNIRELQEQGKLF